MCSSSVAAKEEMEYVVPPADHVSNLAGNGDDSPVGGNSTHLIDKWFNATTLKAMESAHGSMKGNQLCLQGTPSLTPSISS